MFMCSTVRQLGVAAVASACLVAVGCGSDDDGTRPTVSGPSGAEQRDGAFSARNDLPIPAVGDRRQHVRAVAALRRLQVAFRRRDFVTACARVDDFLLSQFRSSRVAPDASCRRRIADFARALERERRRRGPNERTLRVLAVRSYGDIAGIWVEDADGKRIRVPFKRTPGRGWRLELGSFPSPEVLAAKLAGGPAGRR